MQPLWPSLLVFLLVIAAIPATAWLLRRGQSLGVRGNAGLGIAGALAVGPRERIALVRADARWLVVGITAQSITLLAELDGPPAGLAATTTTASGFPELLRTLARRHAEPS
ncbi:MAG: flagellar biosynthetic protein FliO [Burkholderiales bacterium]|nr:flagellar biosynthetic protein FliO [Burkholderiales bacterium]HMM51121.1 flagellar biosynthetic protein FliO [Burkholderiaceae bacterium]